MAKNHYDEFKQQIVSLYKTGKTAKQLAPVTIRLMNKQFENEFRFK
ncbi:hypothetical protein [Spiroplasma poulsonii]|nr:hypothetical protein [Spiroplasma poulsonii]UNF62146.1 hypothetical protein MNU24_01395 [Spiroplasma poulsonii]